MVYSSRNTGLSILFLVTTFHFLVVLNKHNNKSMGNCISKISKDRLLALEEFMKKKISFEKEKARPGLDMLTGETYTRIYSIKGLPKKKKTFAPFQAGVGWRDLF